MPDQTDSKAIRIYQASSDDGVFVATVLEDTTKLPPCPNYGEWRLYTETALDGTNKAKYREVDAARDIDRTGYHMFRVVIRPHEVE